LNKNISLHIPVNIFKKNMVIITIIKEKVNEKNYKNSKKNRNNLILLLVGDS
jgi:DUF438 domain-containing protein